MNTVPNDFAVIGGDLRQAYMAGILSAKGYRVIVYGLPAETEKQSGIVKKAETLPEAIQSSKIIIGGIPLTKDQNTIDILKDTLTEDNQFFAGCISEEFKKFGDSKHIFMYDYMKNEELTVFNTIATAEGTIAEALIRHPGNLHGEDCLIIGYGKCAATLAHKLSGLSAKITVCARNKVSRAIAASYGYEVIGFQELDKNLGKFEYIFNTVPKEVLDRQLLAYVGKQSLIIDIASAPGGIDFLAAQEMNINASLCPGLPGKYAPKASAVALTEVLLKYKR